MKIKYALVKFENIDLKTRQAVKLRGYFANEYNENELVHNHKEEKVIYDYPKIQYKVIHRKPMICGIDIGAKTAIEMGWSTDLIDIDNRKIDVFQKNIIKEEQDFGAVDHYIEYKFLTPWIALNQKNSKLYKNLSDMEKEDMLKRILIGNILSMAKGLEYTINKKLYSWICVKECDVNFKNIKMKGFVGNFKINFLIPDYLGIGKSVSRGFGTIQRS